MTLYHRSDDDIHDRLTIALARYVRPQEWAAEVAAALLPVVRNLLNDAAEQGADRWRRQQLNNLVRRAQTRGLVE